MAGPSIDANYVKETVAEFIRSHFRLRRDRGIPDLGSLPRGAPIGASCDPYAPSAGDVVMGLTLALAVILLMLFTTFDSTFIYRGF